MYVCVYVCMYVCMYVGSVCIYIYIYLYVYINYIFADATQLHGASASFGTFSCLSEEQRREAREKLRQGAQKVGVEASRGLGMSQTTEGEGKFWRLNGLRALIYIHIHIICTRKYTRVYIYIYIHVCVDVSDLRVA